MINRISTARQAELKAQDEARKTLGQRLYGSSRAGGGSIDLAVGNAFDRLETWARQRNRPDQLAEIQQQRREVYKFAVARNMNPQDLEQMLTVYRENVLHAPSPEALVKRCETGRISLIQETGSQHEADRRLSRADAFTKEIEAASPTFAHTARTFGVTDSPRYVNAAAKYAPTEQETKPQ